MRLIMAKFRFQDLEIWQMAIEIADKLKITNFKKNSLRSRAQYPASWRGHAPCSMRL